MKRSYRLRTIIGIAFIVVTIALWFSGILQYVSLENIQRNADYLRMFVSTCYVRAVLYFLGLYVMSSVFALPLASLLTMVAGFLFGFTAGLVYVVIGSTIGATFSFILMRYLVGEYIQDRYAARLASFNASLNRYGGYYLIFVRLIPVIPFFVINMLASFTRVSLLLFIVTTFIGVIPVAMIYSFVGQELGTIHGMHDLMTPRILVAFGLLIGLALSPLLVRAYKRFARTR